MKTWAAAILLLFSLPWYLQAEIGSPAILENPARRADDSGGPDAFGYTWRDSREPGGPTYQWFNITGTGVRVEGLGDDVVAGPFSLGFPFHYYWYDVTQFYLGSNGYLQFGSPDNIGQPFPSSIPLTAVPNDFLAVYMADWDPSTLSGQAGAYYWTNYADTCIVSFVDYPAFFLGGSHDFQVILAGTDSTITFQYGQQQGLVLNNDLLIGIECISGAVGLEHSHDQYINYENFAIKFFYPDTSSYQVHDLAAQAVANQASQGFFLETGELFSLWAAVKNTGNQVEGSYSAQFRILQEGGGEVYIQNVQAGPIQPGEIQEFHFTPYWAPAQEGQYFLSLTVAMTGDMNPANDEKFCECHAVNLPGILRYDDGSSERSWSWQGGLGGMAQRFTPPAYPARIDSLAFFVGEPAGSQPFLARLLDESASGQPNSVIFEQEIPAAGPNSWYGINTTSQNLVIDSAGFFVAYNMMGVGTPPLGMDSSAAQLGSRQSWEFTGLWAPFRNAETADFLIRCSITSLAPPNQPPQITATFPAELDTISLDTSVVFWASAFDPDGDLFTWEWKYDNQVVGADSALTLSFPELGAHGVEIRVWDGQLADSVEWDLYVVPVGVRDAAAGLVQEFALLLPYPNPFNSQVVITYELPVAGQVKVSVHDVFGREAAVLEKGWRAAGRYKAVLAEENLASGLYFVKLQCGSFSQVQKVVLLK